MHDNPDSNAPPASLEADYFDGKTARRHRVAISTADGRLRVAPDPASGLPAFELPLADVKWPERTRHGARIARLPGNASLQSVNAVQWDAWYSSYVSADSLVVHAQQSWRGTLVALALLLVVLAGMYTRGLPWAARGMAGLIPAQVDTLIGAQTLDSLDGRLLSRSRLPEADQQRLRAAFAEAARKTWGAATPAFQLEFRSGHVGGRVPAQGQDTRPGAEPAGDSATAPQPKPEAKRRAPGLGPNALALPGGIIIVTDELVELVRDDDAVIGVLGHELGHVRRRHVMRQLVQVAALGAVASVAFGDYGTLITTAPVILASMGYSRDAEREADDDAVRLLQATGRSPLAMVKFFEAMRAPGGGTDDSDAGLGIALSSHPADAERIARFRAAAAAR